MKFPLKWVNRNTSISCRVASAGEWQSAVCQLARPKTSCRLSAI